MEIIRAKNSGFCFGVDNAVNMAFDTDYQGKVYTLGQLIHNKKVVEDLKKRGIVVLEDLAQLKEGDCVIIRAHGIGKDVYDNLKSHNVKIIDATCPYVKRIHEIVKREHAEGHRIVIVGDKHHPEVIGINGWCDGKALITSNEEEVIELPYSDETAAVVSQTTFRRSKFEDICELIRKKFAFVIKFDTICNATVKRQTEAEFLSGKVDVMIVVGGRSSSNTQKLYEICKKNCPETYLIENADELPLLDKNVRTVGITAGASTPEKVIKEVIFHMEGMMNGQGHENEIDFGEAVEMTLIKPKTNEIIKGKIIGYNNSDVFVDLGYKADGLIPMEEFLEDPDFDPEKDLEPGKEIEALIVKINDGEGNVSLSKKKVDAIRGYELVEEAFNNKTPIEVIIKEIVKGGAVAEYRGVRVFIPASQISDRYVKDLAPYKGKKVKLVITEMANRRRVVGSCRALIEAEKKQKSEEFWSGVEVGKEYTGTVKSLTKFGAFVDLGGVDGLVHISELSWKRIDHPSELLSVGDEVTVKVLSFDTEKNKVSLGYRKMEDNPWYNIESKYAVGEVVTGTILRMVPFGVFVELEEGVEGLVHISQISNVRLGRPEEVLEVGQKVEMKIMDINVDLKKISLSIKEVSPIDPEVIDEPADHSNAEEVSEKVPTTHNEVMTNTIGEILSEKQEAAVEAEKEDKAAEAEEKAEVADEVEETEQEN
ncbi:MAG: bifunctional 4-hydroxy-3-methylbut-2-enyl diphosphate reductase/30S ribosomal protein S1 [Acetivibrionales bacterium]|jgi:4-hydroxy-3-methylbut-2-enyl diphosphate reductase|nr:bifunctional 4-hydroxy-3-methylbut-2-enyl diphosphate reductase/30S ribosomal protein S1 [Clostridiaceae bacterium]